MAEGGSEGVGGGGERGGASPFQGMEMFAFYFTDGWRFGVCNALGVLQSGAAVSHWQHDSSVMYFLACRCSWIDAFRWGILRKGCFVQFGGTMWTSWV